jgi:hypothetical protein
LGTRGSISVIYLTSSDYVTGTIIPVDGGSTTGVW